MKITTSTRISLWFSVLVMVLTAILWFLVNWFFWRNWYVAEQGEMSEYLHLQQLNESRPGSKPLRLWWKFDPIIRLDQGDDYFDRFGKDKLNERRFSKWLVQVDDERYLARYLGESVYVKDMTRIVGRQRHLVFLSVLATLLSWLLGFAFSKLLVKNGLRDLHTLHDEIAQQKLWNLQVVWNYDHLPAHDEIAELASTFRKNADTLQSQIHDMKQFISNASHELRTPLMSLSAKNDLTKKTKDYEGLVEHTTASVGTMQALIDWLLMLGQPEQDYEIITIQLDELTSWLVQEYSDLYAAKDVSIHTSLDETSVQASEFALKTILSNIIHNAFKYVDQGWDIEILIKDSVCSIRNTWAFISDQELKHIWKPFWQSDTARTDKNWFGLWLSLVKRLCDQYGYDIQVTSSETKGTMFSIYF